MEREVSLARWRLSSRWISSSRPTRTTRLPSSRAARIAPATVLAGAKSPPIASKAIAGFIDEPRSEKAESRGEATNALRLPQPRSRRGPCRCHSEGKPGEAACPRGSGGISKGKASSGHHGPAGGLSGLGNVFVSDSAWYPARKKCVREKASKSVVRSLGSLPRNGMARCSFLRRTSGKFRGKIPDRVVSKERRDRSAPGQSPPG